MTATASRVSTFTPRLVGGPEQYISDKAEDLVFNANVYTYLLKKKNRIKLGRWGHTHVEAINQSRASHATPGTHLDPVSFNIPDGPQAATFTYGEYRQGIAYSLSEMADNGGPERKLDLIGERIDKSLLTFVEDINYDLIHGNGSNALRMLGLYQAIYPKAQATNTADTATRTNMRQADNVYGGIQRVASAGTGWENVSAALSVTSNSGWTNGTDNFFKFTTNQEKCKGLKALDNLFFAATYGRVKPDCIISTPRPWLDYQNTVAQVARYMLAQNEGANDPGDTGIPYILHQGALWGVEEQMAASGTAGSATTAAADMILLLNTDYIDLKVEEGFYFEPSREWMQFPNQTVEGTIVMFRAFHEVLNPRYQAVGYNYGVN